MMKMEKEQMGPEDPSSHQWRIFLVLILPTVPTSSSTIKLDKLLTSSGPDGFKVTIKRSIHGIQLEELDTPGILPFELGNAKIIEEYHQFSYSFDLQTIKNNITDLMDFFEGFCKDLHKAEKLRHHQSHLEIQIKGLIEKYYKVTSDSAKIPAVVCDPPPEEHNFLIKFYKKIKHKSFRKSLAKGVDGVYSQINNLNNVLSDLESAIVSSKTKIVHSSLWTTENIRKIRNLYPDFDKSLHGDLCKVQSYIHDDDIEFVFQIPAVSRETYTYYKLYPVPNNDKSIIIPPGQYLTLGYEKYQYDNQECQKQSGIYFCNKKQLRKRTDCVVNLIRGGSVDICEPAHVNVAANIIKRVDDFYLILILSQPTTISMDCNNRIKSKMIVGSFLLMLPKTCEVTIDDVLYQNTKPTKYAWKPIIIQNDGKSKKTDSVVSIRDIDVQNLNNLWDGQKQVKKVNADPGEVDTDSEAENAMASSKIYVLVTISIVCIAGGLITILKCVLDKKGDFDKLNIMDRWR